MIGPDGSAIIHGQSSLSLASTPPGSFNLEEIDAEIGSLSKSNPGLEWDITVYSSLRPDLVLTTRYYPEDLDYVKALFRDILGKSTLFLNGPEKLRTFLYETPPMGLDDLELEDSQLKGYINSAGKPFHWEKRKQKSALSKWTTITRKYPLVGDISTVAVILFSTPWPYLALLSLMCLGLRRYWLNKRSS